MTERLEAANIAYAMVNTPLDLQGHPHLRRIEIDTPGGRVPVPAPPARRRDERRTFGRVPALDQDGAAIRQDFGGD